MQILGAWLPAWRVRPGPPCVAKRCQTGIGAQGHIPPRAPARLSSATLRQG
jgi:hypothetical protein